MSQGSEALSWVYTTTADMGLAPANSNLLARLLSKSSKSGRFQVDVLDVTQLKSTLALQEWRLFGLNECFDEKGE